MKECTDSSHKEGWENWLKYGTPSIPYTFNTLYYYWQCKYSLLVTYLLSEYRKICPFPCVKLGKKGLPYIQINMVFPKNEYVIQHDS
jgi:hypothetical protein